MTEYIKKQAARDVILGEPPEAHYPSWYEERIEQIPVDDVTRVVRCRDCRKRGLPECPMETGKPGINSNEDGFCRRGAEWPPNLAEQLKPCPFCGRTHIILRRESKHTSLYSCYYAACGATTGLCVSRENAVERWNRRTAHDD